MAGSNSKTEHDSTDRPRPLATIGPFALQEFVGKGGMGDVWRAHHRETRLEVAIKVITEQRTHRQKYQVMFQREARSIASLDHPGIVKLYDFGHVSEATEARTGGEFVAGSPYLAMEFCEERGLDEAGEIDTWAQVRMLLLSILDALAHAHARGVVHRDIKPGNVLLRQPNSNWTGVKLADFGLAFLLDPKTSIERRGAATGTPAYMPPEQLQGKWRDIGPWTDLYSVGCLAYELVCGSRPFDGRSIITIAQSHLNDPVPPLSPRMAVPDGFENWLLRMLTKQPLRRFRSAAEAAWGLNQLEDPRRDALDRGDALPQAPNEPLETLFQLPESEDALLLDGIQSAHVDGRSAMEPSRPPMPRNWQTRSERPGDRVMEPTLGLLGLRRIPIVGRESVRDTLWGHLAKMTTEEGFDTVLLRGPTGYGKRTLARWLAERAHETGVATTLTLSSTATTESAVVSCLKTFFRTSGLEPEDAWERVSTWLAQFGSPNPHLAEQIAEMLTSPPSETDDRDWFASVFARTLANIAIDKPVMLVCPELQDSPEIIRALSNAASLIGDGAHVLCVGTIREDQLSSDAILSDSIDDLVDATDALEIEVGALGDEQMRRLTSHLLRLSGDVAERACNYADGNPQFAIELVQYWAETDLLEWSPRGMCLRDTDRELIPTSSIGIWGERVSVLFESMHANEVTAVEIAAVAGLYVDARTWSAICERAGVAEPARVTERLFKNRLAEPIRDGWQFAHAMLRHAIVQLARERDRLERHHATCASILEQTKPGDRLAIGLHLYHSKQLNDALNALLSALERMREYGRYSQGALHLKTVEMIIESLELPDDDRRSLQSRYLSASFKMHTNQLEGLEDDLLEAIELAEGTEHRDMEDALELRLMELYQTSGRFEEALELANTLLEKPDMRFPNRFQAACSKGKILARIGRADEALQLATDLQDHPDLAMIRPARRVVLNRIEGFSLLRLERLDEAVVRLREAADLHAQVGARTGVAMMRMACANALMNMGRYDEAEELCRDVIQNMQGYAPRSVQNAELHLAFTLFYKGDLVETRELVLGQLGAIRRNGRTYIEGFLLCLLAGIAAKRHQWEDFERRFEQMVDAIDEVTNVDADFARVMRICADEAVDDGREDIALRALELADSQLEALELEDDLGQVRERLASLDKNSR